MGYPTPLSIILNCHEWRALKEEAQLLCDKRREAAQRKNIVLFNDFNKQLIDCVIRQSNFKYTPPIYG